MASGQGKRFGGNKLMADFAGQPLIARVLEATRDLFPRRVVVTRHRDVAQFCRARGIDVVLHDLPLRSDTVRLGLEAIGTDADGCLFCPGDQPLLSRETVADMVHAIGEDPRFIRQLRHGDTPAAPVFFPASCFEALRALPPGKGGGVLLKKYPEQVRYVPARDAFECMDVDTPDDLNTLLTYWER